MTRLPFILLGIILWILSVPSLHAEFSPENLYQQAEQLAQAGAWDQAITLLEQAKEEVDDEDLIHIDLLILLAKSYQAQGMYHNALNTFHEAEQFLKSTNNPKQSISLWSALGDLYLAIGNSNDSKKYLQKAYYMATRQLDSKETLANILNLFGNLYMVDRIYPLAIDFYQRSLSNSKQLNHQSLESKTSLNLARAFLHDEQFEEAEAQLRSTFAHLKKHPPSYSQTFSLVSLGILAQNFICESLPKSEQTSLPKTEAQVAKNRVQEDNIIFKEHPPKKCVKDNKSRSRLFLLSYHALNHALKTTRNSRLKSYVYGHLGRLYERDLRLREATQLTQSAIFFAQQSQAFEILYRWERQLGRLFKSQGLLEEAIELYRAATQSLHKVRHSLNIGYRLLPGTFQELIASIYYEFADLLLQQADKLSKAASGPSEQSEALLREARNTIELLKTAELEDYFQDECVLSLKFKDVQIEDQISKDTVILYPIPLPNRLVLLLSSSLGLKQFEVAISSNQLNQVATQLSYDLQNRKSQQYRRSSQQLYQWLITPIKQELMAQQIKTLIIVPDGKLRTIPFSALHDDQQFLIENYAVVTTPSLTLTDPQALKRKKIKALLGGLSEAVELPNVEKELIELQALLNGQLLIDESFTIQRVENGIKNEPFSVIHIASHAQFDADPQKTFIRTYDKKITLDQLSELIRYGQFRNEPIELLTLSACQTAVGDDQAALGLAGVAIQAGARSVLASLWSVEDESTALLMAEFYNKLLDPNFSKAQALQHAQKEIKRIPDYQHPAFWAPFILIGNWL